MTDCFHFNSLTLPVLCWSRIKRINRSASTFKCDRLSSVYTCDSDAIAACIMTSAAAASASASAAFIRDADDGRNGKWLNGFCAGRWFKWVTAASCRLLCWHQQSTLFQTIVHCCGFWSDFISKCNADRALRPPSYAGYPPFVKTTPSVLFMCQRFSQLSCLPPARGPGERAH